MLADQTRVVVTDSECVCHSMRTKHVHHRHFPEIWAEHGALDEAALYLISLLQRSCEGAGSHWRRDAIEAAISDVRAFLETVSRAEDVPVCPTRRPAAFSPEVRSCSAAF